MLLQIFTSQLLAWTSSEKVTLAPTSWSQPGPPWSPGPFLAMILNTPFSLLAAPVLLILQPGPHISNFSLALHGPWDSLLLQLSSLFPSDPPRRVAVAGPSPPLTLPSSCPQPDRFSTPMATAAELSLSSGPSSTGHPVGRCPVARSSPNLSSASVNSPSAQASHPLALDTRPPAAPAASSSSFILLLL